jgi:hypothetical protein
VGAVAAAPAAAPAPAAGPNVSPADGAPAPAPPVPAAPTSPVRPVGGQAGQGSHASPSVRAFARELGVDLAQVKGTGPKNRILKEDVSAFIKGAMSTGVVPGKTVAAAAAGSLGGGLDLLPWPKVDFAKFGEIDVKPLSRIKKISGQNLARNWAMIPAVTYHEDADITDLEAFRVQMNKENEKSGRKLTMLAFLIKACVRALQKFPEFNTSLDGDNLVYKKYFNIAFAADTPNGLVVPVVKNADQQERLRDRRRNRRAGEEGARRQARPGRHVRRLLHDFQPRRHRRHLLRADRQCAGSGHPRRQQVGDEAGVGRQAVRAAPDPAAVADRRPPRDRRRAGHPLQRVSRATAAADDALRAPGEFRARAIIAPLPTTITVVKKNGQVAISAESLTTFGDTRLGAEYKAEHDKILHIGDSWIGVCGSSAHHHAG